MKSKLRKYKTKDPESQKLKTNIPEWADDIIYPQSVDQPRTRSKSKEKKKR